MNRIDLSLPGGLPFTQDTLNFMQKTYSDCLTAIGGVFGDYVVISGCENNNGIIAPGWVAVNGEVLYTPGGSGDTVYIAETSQSVVFEDGQTKPVYFNRTLEFGNDTVILYWGNFVYLKDLFKPTEWVYIPKESPVNPLYNLAPLFRHNDFGTDVNSRYYLRYRINPTGLITLQGYLKSVSPVTTTMGDETIVLLPGNIRPVKRQGSGFWFESSEYGIETAIHKDSNVYDLKVKYKGNIGDYIETSFILNYYKD